MNFEILKDQFEAYQTDDGWKAWLDIPYPTGSDTFDLIDEKWGLDLDWEFAFSTAYKPANLKLSAKTTFKAEVGEVFMEIFNLDLDEKEEAFYADAPNLARRHLVINAIEKTDEVLSKFVTEKVQDF